MFGVMRMHVCTHRTAEATRRRMHYCGACKTLGRLYGQHTRLLLNFDAVFLAELLTALSPEQKPENWDEAYRSFHCFRLPGNPAEIPAALRIAAAGTLLIAQLKLDDHVVDGPSMAPRLARRLLSPAMRAARADLAALGFPLEQIDACIQRQVDVETRAGASGSLPESVLERCAEPSAAATALIFQYAARCMGAEEAMQGSMHALGYHFGAIVYLLDAIEDFERDGEAGQFNALRAAFGRPSGDLSSEEAEEAAGVVLAERAAFREALERLPLEPAVAASFLSRLDAAIRRRVDLPADNPPATVPSSLAPSSCRAQPVAARAGRLQSAYQQTRTLLASERSRAAGSRWAGLKVSSLVPLAYLQAATSPALASSAATLSDCGDLAMNLMFASSAVRTAAVPLFAHRSSEEDNLPDAGGALEPGVKSSTSLTKGRKQSSGSCCCGDCSYLDCNDCGCLCDAGCCACDSLDLCSCCCN